MTLRGSNELRSPLRCARSLAMFTKNGVGNSSLRRHAGRWAASRACPGCRPKSAECSNQIDRLAKRARSIASLDHIDGRQAVLASHRRRAIITQRVDEILGHLEE